MHKNAQNIQAQMHAMHLTGIQEGILLGKGRKILI